MKLLRDKVRARTGGHRIGTDIRDVISDLNPILQLEWRGRSAACVSVGRSWREG
jgi:hypothetical protein